MAPRSPRLGSRISLGSGRTSKSRSRAAAVEFPVLCPTPASAALLGRALLQMLQRLRKFLWASGHQLRGELVIAGQQEAEVAVASLGGRKSLLPRFPFRAAWESLCNDDHQHHLSFCKLSLKDGRTSITGKKQPQSRGPHAPSSISFIRVCQTESGTAGMSSGPNLGVTRCRNDICRPN